MIHIRKYFDANRCQQVHPIGSCEIKDNRGGRPLEEESSYVEPYHLAHMKLIDCIVGGRVIIGGVRGCILHYDIADDVITHNITTLKATGETTLDDGYPVGVFNEVGSREAPICDILTAQTAYVLAMYHHDRELQAAFSKLVREYIDSVRSDRDTIGKSSNIKHCGLTTNAGASPHSSIIGASVLENGSVNNAILSPIKVGCGVICQDFIFSVGCAVSDGSNVSCSFIGQGCSVTHLFSAHDSLFLASRQYEDGEVCTVFVDPFTVTMHKNSFLIAGYYSFLSVGSGPNQSNHFYGPGPIHQGIAERDSKTTSDSYAL